MSSHLMLIRQLSVVCYITKIADITDIGQNPDTSWIFMIFLVLSAINLSKRFVCSLRFVGSLLYVVCSMTLDVMLKKHTKSHKSLQTSTEKGYKIRQIPFRIQ